MDNLTRIIKLQLQDTVLHASSTLAGYEGDHCATQLQLDIPPELVSEDYTYQLSISSGGITSRALLQYDSLVFDLPVAVMVTGNIFVSLIISDGTQIIRKSDVCSLTVNPALDTPSEDVENRYTGLLEDSVAKFCDATEQLNAVTINTPYIGDNANWYVYDAETQKYVDTGICAKGEGGAGITDNSVATEHLKDRSVTYAKLAQNVEQDIKESLESGDTQKLIATYTTETGGYINPTSIDYTTGYITVDQTGDATVDAISGYTGAYGLVIKYEERVVQYNHIPPEIIKATTMGIKKIDDQTVQLISGWNVISKLTDTSSVDLSSWSLEYGRSAQKVTFHHINQNHIKLCIYCPALLPGSYFKLYNGSQIITDCYGPKFASDSFSASGSIADQVVSGMPGWIELVIQPTEHGLQRVVISLRTFKRNTSTDDQLIPNNIQTDFYFLAGTPVTKIDCYAGASSYGKWTSGSKFDLYDLS